MAREGGRQGRPQRNQGQALVLERVIGKGPLSRLGLVSLVLVPCAIFGFVCYLFAHWFWRLPKVVLFGALLIAAASLAAAWSRPQARRHSPWLYWVCVLTGLAALGASTAGLLAYYAQLKPYWRYSDAWYYTNVMPSDPAGAYIDAGKITFSDDAQVDTNRSLGFMDATVYCVAPIIDDTGHAGPVQFWAVGLDCCEARGAFACDDAWDERARSGLVVDEALEYPWAIRQAEAAFGVRSAESPVLVRWVVDPTRVQNNHLRWGVGILLVSWAASLVFNCAAVSFIQSGAKGMV